jgi:hypothetical protein
MWCGCFCCLQTFAAEEVIDWIDDGETPLCPFCGVDAVLLGVTDLATLWDLRARRFGRSLPLTIGPVEFDPPREGPNPGEAPAR